MTICVTLKRVWILLRGAVSGPERETSFTPLWMRCMESDKLIYLSKIIQRWSHLVHHFCHVRMNQITRNQRGKFLRWFRVFVLGGSLIWKSPSTLSWNPASVVTFTVCFIPSNQPHLAIHLALSSLAEFSDCVEPLASPCLIQIFCLAWNTLGETHLVLQVESSHVAFLSPPPLPLSLYLNPSE